MAGYLRRCLYLLLLLLLCTRGSYGSCKKSPVIIVPGIMGSQLEARVSHPKSHWYCPSTHHGNWYRIWFSLIGDVVPYVDECFKKYIRLHYDVDSGSYSNTEGVEIRVPGFGNTSSIEYLDPDNGFLRYLSAYCDKMVELLTKHGYTRGKDVRGAPYDWRLGPIELQKEGYFSRLKALIEETYSQNDNCMVTLVVHSMGGLVSHFFFTEIVDQLWKDTYIKQYITLSAVWLGASRSLKALISGDDDSIFRFTKKMAIRPVERSFPSDYWLLPFYRDNTWNTSHPLVKTPSRGYTAQQIPDIINTLNYTHSSEMYRGVKDASSRRLLPPNITTYCLYTTDKDTELSFEYTSSGEHQFPDGTPTAIKGRGDGKVPEHSLKACQNWADQQVKPVTTKEFYNVDHESIIRDDKVLAEILSLVLK